jgi:activator of 2-hydroxyglutaryl-CoA dehydratase
MQKDLVKLLAECIDMEKLAIGLVEGIAEQALKDAVAKSATPIDDAVVAMILPALNPAMEDLIKKQIADLKAKILA